MGSVKFSVAAPRTHIEPHCAPNNLRIRCHLGMIVPEGCEIRVRDQTRSWEEGKCLILDDSFDHEVWNRSDRTRVILLVDFWHQDLTELEIQVINELRKVIWINKGDH
jgi:aspartate beta-hydroxylase